MTGHNFQDILGGADCAVPAQTPEFAGKKAFRDSVSQVCHRQGKVCHIVLDAYGEPCPGVVGEDSGDLGRGGVFGTQAVAAGIELYICPVSLA